MDRVTMESIAAKEKVANESNYIFDLWEKLVKLEKVNPLDEGKLDSFTHFYYSYKKKYNKRPSLKDAIRVL